MFRKGDPKVMRAWSWYDWANSVYPLVITTALFPIFFENVTGGNGSDVVQFFGFQLKNTVLYSFVVGASFLIVVFLSPLLSGIADLRGSKLNFLKAFCYLGSLACASLFFFDGTMLEISMLSVFLASIGYWGSIVFYNAYLPEIAYPEDQDKLSARGFALGYFGSALLLILLLVFIESGIMDSKGTATRICFIITGLWWAGFAQVTYRRLKHVRSYRANPDASALSGFREVRAVMKRINRTVRLRRYLLSFFVFSMGIQTIMLMAVLFAKKEIGVPQQGLIISVLIIQFIGIAGAFLFSRASTRYGNLPTLALALLIWMGACIYAYFLQTAVEFYCLAGVVGFVMGGTQALARSTYSKFLPETNDHASYFSFYDITEKIGIVLGMFAFGLLEQTWTMRTSVLSLIAFFVIGFVLLLWVPKEESVEGWVEQEHDKEETIEDAI